MKRRCPAQDADHASTERRLVERFLFKNKNKKMFLVRRKFHQNAPRSTHTHTSNMKQLAGHTAQSAPHPPSMHAPCPPARPGHRSRSGKHRAFSIISLDGGAGSSGSTRPVNGGAGLINSCSYSHSMCVVCAASAAPRPRRTPDVVQDVGFSQHLAVWPPFWTPVARGDICGQAGDGWPRASAVTPRGGPRFGRAPLALCRLRSLARWAAQPLHRFLSPFIRVFTSSSSLHLFIVLFVPLLLWPTNQAVCGGCGGAFWGAQPWARCWWCWC